jgi:MFS family permease
MGHGVYAFSVSFLGMAVGPLFVGMISDGFQRTMNEADALRYALTVGQLMFIAAAFCGWRAYLGGSHPDALRASRPLANVTIT